MFQKIALLNQKIQDLNEEEAKILKELSEQKKNLENLLGDVKVNILILSLASCFYIIDFDGLL